MNASGEQLNAARKGDGMGDENMEKMDEPKNDVPRPGLMVAIIISAPYLVIARAGGIK